MKTEYPKNGGQSKYPGPPAKQIEEHLLEPNEIVQLKGGAPTTRKYTGNYAENQPAEPDLGRYGDQPRNPGRIGPF